MAARTMSATLRLWPRCTTSAPRACRSRRIMLIAASWPSKSEAADTKRRGGRASRTGPAAARPSAPGVSPWRASSERLRARELRREAVIRAAAREFNRKGYHNTSLDDIATALEVTKPTVYYYVTSKEQLLFECFVAGVAQIRAAFRSARQLEAPARERLSAVLRHYGETVGSEFRWRR